MSCSSRLGSYVCYIHMPNLSSPPTAWRPILVAADRFHWLLGARVALAFVGPLVVAHLAGRWQGDAAVVALAGLLVALVGGGLPAGPTRRTFGPLLVAAVPAAALLDRVV